MNLSQFASVLRARYLVDATPVNQQVNGLPFTTASLANRFEEVVEDWVEGD